MEGEEDIISIGTFIDHLTYYLKLAIYINKGTDRDDLLDKCIKLYNKYIAIAESRELGAEDETFVRKCLKRLNLVLKVDAAGNPIDIRTKENQLKMVYFLGHPSLLDNNLNAMYQYATNNDTNILVGIPLTFVLRESKYRELLWQYTRSLFYISQLLISKVDPEAKRGKDTAQKNKVFGESFEQFETILVKISEIEEEIKINKLMAADKFLDVKLKKSGITGDKVNEAREEVKQIFNKKGLGEDNSISRMVDSISDKLTSFDFSQGNVLQNMFSIAQNVAQEMRGDLEKDPHKFQNTLGTITEVFQEAMEDGSKSGQEVPAELKAVFNNLVSLQKGESSSNGEDITSSLDALVEANGLDREEFYSSIKNEDGEIDVSKLEKLLDNFK